MITIIGSKRPFLIIATISLVAVVLIPTFAALFLVPVCAFRDYDIDEYNCWHFARDVKSHFERLGLTTQLKKDDLHVWVEVKLWQWVRYENGLPAGKAVKAEVITCNELDRYIAQGYRAVLVEYKNGGK